MNERFGVRRRQGVGSRRAGFSLVETLVVLAVVTVLATLGYMSFRELSIRWRLQESAEIIAREIDRAREEARAANVVSSVSLVAGSSTVSATGRAVSLPNGTTLSAVPSRPWLVFVPPYGTAFLSSDATYDAGTDVRFQEEAIEVSWTPAPERTRTVRVVGVLGKPVMQ